MGIFDKLGQTFGGKASREESSIDDYMTSAEMEEVDVLHEPADMYIKPLLLKDENDVRTVQEELGKRNILLLDISEIRKRPNTANNILAQIKAYVQQINGDIGQIDDTRVLVTPAKVKIIKRKRTEQK
ncbi:MAG: cell division protein SepF [Candidatus Micrarchaeaceae archaeon]